MSDVHRDFSPEHGGEVLCELELTRRRNIKRNMEMMKQLGILFERSSGSSEPSTPSSSHSNRKRKISRNIKSSIPLSERRRSMRLASFNPVQFSDEVSKVILGDEDTCLVCMEDDSDDDSQDRYKLDDDLDKENKRRKRNSYRQADTQREIPSVDEITEDHLKNVCEIVSEKTYSQDGTTCHQCRQKTLDQKTYCRADSCFGVRGQFCGPCLKNRYGESVAEALKDPDWMCPPCRGLCNCSICRTHKGKMPTGQLFHLAQERGYKSVRHFLEGEVENEEED